MAVFVGSAVGISLVWFARDDGTPQDVVQVTGPESGSAAGDRIERAAVEPWEAGEPRPGSLRDTLLAASEGNRRTMFLRTLRDKGYGCAEITATGAIGGDGVAWRVNCGAGRIYAIRITGFDEFEIAPSQYGDLYAPVPMNVVPQESRTLELQEE